MRLRLMTFGSEDEHRFNWLMHGCFMRSYSMKVELLGERTLVALSPERMRNHAFGA